MKNFFVYILHSKTLNRFYTGLTTLNVEERVENHLAKKYSSLNFTQKAGDWGLFLSIHCESLSQARNIEMHIKRMKSSSYIKNLRVYPELHKKLMTEA